MNLEFEISRLKRNSEAAWARMDYEKSEELMRQRQKLSPQDPRLLLDLGFQSGLRCDYAKVSEYFERAIRVAGWQTAAFTAAGFHCLNFSQPALAQSYFERALKKKSRGSRNTRGACWHLRTVGAVRCSRGVCGARRQAAG